MMPLAVMDEMDRRVKCASSASTAELIMSGNPATERATLGFGVELRLTATPYVKRILIVSDTAKLSRFVSLCRCLSWCVVVFRNKKNAIGINL